MEFIRIYNFYQVNIYYNYLVWEFMFLLLIPSFIFQLNATKDPIADFIK